MFKQHRFWAWASILCMVMVMITGYGMSPKAKKIQQTMKGDN